MRKLSIFSLLIICALSIGMMVVSADDDDDKAKTTAEVRVGYRAVDESGSLGSVAEYRSLEDSVSAAFKMKHYGEDTYVKAWGYYNDKDDIAARFKADMNRVVQFEGNYVELLHRLEHDTLTNLNAVKTPKVTRSTDFDPNGEYSIVRSEWDLQAKFQHPDVPGVMIEAFYNQIDKQGHRQARTMSKCANCHVVGYNREIDSVTKTYGLKASYDGQGFSISGELSGRTFEDSAATPTHVYMDVLHPTKYVPVFNDRVVFSNLDGALPFDKITPNTKWKAKLDANMTGEELGNVHAGAVFSEVENDDLGLSMTFTGFHGGWYRKLTDTMSINVKGRYYTIDNDDYFYDAVEPVAIAGAYPGQTYRERWGADGYIDLDRQSTYNRDVFQVDGKLSYRFAKRSRMALDYRFKSVDREHYAVTEGGDTATTHNRFRASLNTSLMKGNRINAEFIYEMIDQPFVALKSGGTKKFDPEAAPSPLSGKSIQYFVLYANHEVDLAASPSQDMKLRVNLKQKLSPGVSLMAGFNYRDSKNDELNMSEWTKDSIGANAAIWFAASPEFSGMVSYTYKDSEKETLFILPIYDG